MRVFLKKLFIFILGFLLLITVGLLIPATPRATSSLLFAKIEKDALLDSARSPRIILIGGSNLSLSINSQIIKDSLNHNPVNTGISANIGLAYMLDHTLEYIRPKDIVIVSPEYSQFYDRQAYGREELLRTIMDVSPKELFRLRRKQFWQIIPYLPKYALSKFQPTEYMQTRNTGEEIYQREAFNEFGDTYKHWGLESRAFPPLEAPDEYDHSVVNILAEYKLQVEKRGASLYITFPALQKRSFENQSHEIATVEKELRKNGFDLLGTPERYKMPEENMFDTPYHLTKEGVDYRTRLLIADIKDMHLQLRAKAVSAGSRGSGPGGRKK